MAYICRNFIGNPTRATLQSTLYMDWNYWTSHVPCQVLDPESKKKINSFLNKSQVTTSYIQDYWETVLPKHYPNRNQTTWEIYKEFSRHTTYTDGTSAYPIRSTKANHLYFLFTECTVQQTETFLDITEQKLANTKKSLCPYDLE